MAVDRPLAPSPSSASSAGCISPVEIPFRYSQGMNSSTFFVRFKYGGTSLLLNLMPPPERSRTFLLGHLDRNLTQPGLDTALR